MPTTLSLRSLVGRLSFGLWFGLSFGLLLGACAADPALRNPVRASAGLAPHHDVEVVIELDALPGNVAVASGRVFFSFHPEGAPEIKLAEVIDNKTFRPFPDDGWQQPRDDGPYFVTPLAVRTDTQGRLWVLDHGDLGQSVPSLTAFDIETRELVHRFEFPGDVAGLGSMLNDFWIDAERGFVYIADTSPVAMSPALVVYDVSSKSARRLLPSHESVVAEPHHVHVQGVFIRMVGVPLRLAVDSIALSPDGATLFYGPLTGSRIYRVDTESLRDKSISAAALAGRVAVAGDKPTTDGIAADSRGRLYFTAIERDGIWRLREDGALEVLAHDPELFAWPDGVHLDEEERWLYVSVSELHRVLGRGTGDLPDHRPFRILRVALD